MVLIQLSFFKMQVGYVPPLRHLIIAHVCMRQQRDVKKTVMTFDFLKNLFCTLDITCILAVDDEQVCNYHIALYLERKLKDILFGSQTYNVLRLINYVFKCAIFPRFKDTEVFPFKSTKISRSVPQDEFRYFRLFWLNKPNLLTE